MKSGSLTLLEPSGPVQACNGTALLLLLPFTIAPLPNKRYGVYRDKFSCTALSDTGFKRCFFHPWNVHRIYRVNPPTAGPSHSQSTNLGR